MVSNAATSLFVMIKSKFAHPSCCLANIFSNTGHRYHAHPAETRTQSFITIDFQRLIVPCETASMRDISRRLARISRSFFDGGPFAVGQKCNRLVSTVGTSTLHFRK